MVVIMEVCSRTMLRTGYENTGCMLWGAHDVDWLYQWPGMLNEEEQCLM